MKFEEQYIKGVWLIKPERHGDARGYFCESFKKAEFENAVGHVEFVQDNESMSSRGVLRGLHFQRGEFSQAKLVRVSQGRVLDVAVDIRKDSPTFGRYVAVELSQENGCQLFIPRHFAHGFLVLSDEAEFCYKCTDFYHQNDEGGIAWNDPDINIRWPEVTGAYSGNADSSNYRFKNSAIIMSEKDKNWPTLKQLIAQEF